MWYSPTFVRNVIDAITARLQRLDSAATSYFTSLHDTYVTIGLKRYDDLRAAIKQRYSGTPVGATESIFAYLAPALPLTLLNPPRFLKPITTGPDPPPATQPTMAS